MYKSEFKNSHIHVHVVLPGSRYCMYSIKSTCKISCMYMYVNRYQHKQKVWEWNRDHDIGGGATRQCRNSGSARQERCWRQHRNQWWVTTSRASLSTCKIHSHFLCGSWTTALFVFLFRNGTLTHHFHVLHVLVYHKPSILGHRLA